MPTPIKNVCYCGGDEDYIIATPMIGPNLEHDTTLFDFVCQRLDMFEHGEDEPIIAELEGTKYLVYVITHA